MSVEELERLEHAVRALIDARFSDGEERGAAGVLLDDGTVLTGTAPDYHNPSTAVCHEIEPYAAAFRLDRGIVASLCLHRTPDRRFLVLSPCGVCRERLAMHGPETLVGVAGEQLTEVRWVRLAEALPHYWMRAFPDEIPDWSE